MHISGDKLAQVVRESMALEICWEFILKVIEINKSCICKKKYIKKLFLLHFEIVFQVFTDDI